MLTPMRWSLPFTKAKRRTKVRSRSWTNAPAGL